MSITTLNPPSPYAQSVEAARLAKLFAESAATSIGSIDNRQIPLQLVPSQVAEIAENVLSELEEGRDLALAPVIYKNLTAAFKTLQTAHSSPVGMQETVAKIGAIATVSFAPKAA
ncbi:MAG: hypothetical protein KBF91_02125 [Alphaproteobacteria bacterium]|nr:hypothetical protein [Alphaproteobacteria bacterium]